MTRAIAPWQNLKKALFENSPFVKISIYEEKFDFDEAFMEEIFESRAWSCLEMALLLSYLLKDFVFSVLSYLLINGNV